MFIISDYTINLIGYRSKYHPCEIEEGTRGSRLTTRAYYLTVLWLATACALGRSRPLIRWRNVPSLLLLCTGMRSLLAESSRATTE
jgi:hypothetical protein